MNRNAWIAVAIVVLVVVLLLAAFLRSVGELQEIYDEENDEDGKLEPNSIERDERTLPGGDREAPLEPLLTLA
jgi:hypothetical protein